MVFLIITYTSGPSSKHAYKSVFAVIYNHCISFTVHLADVLTLLTDDRRCRQYIGPYVSALYGRLRVRVWVYRRVVQ